MTVLLGQTIGGLILFLKRPLIMFENSGDSFYEFFGLDARDCILLIYCLLVASGTFYIYIVHQNYWNVFCFPDWLKLAGAIPCSPSDICVCVLQYTVQLHLAVADVGYHRLTTERYRSTVHTATFQSYA